MQNTTKSTMPVGGLVETTVPADAGRSTLRIGMISYGLPKSGAKRGGYERVADELATGLARRGHAVTVWTYDVNPLDKPYKTKLLPANGLYRNRLGKRLVMGHLGNVLNIIPRYDDIDVLIAHGDSLLLPFLNIPLVRVLHGCALAEALSATRPWRVLSQLVVYVQELLSALTCRHTVGVSKNTLRWNPFVKTVIPLGTNLSRFYPDPLAKTAFPSILFVGTVDGRKRGGMIVKWFREIIRKRYPSAQLWLVTPAGEQESGITFFTGVSDDILAELYRKAWVYASPSSYEGFGLPYLEAMASGTAVVASSNPGSNELIVDGKSGIIASDELFPEALLSLIADRSARLELGAQGILRAGIFSSEAMVDAYEQLIFRIQRSNVQLQG